MHLLAVAFAVVKRSETEILRPCLKLSLKAATAGKHSTAHCASLKPKTKVANRLVLGVSIHTEASGYLLFSTHSLEIVNTTRLGLFIVLAPCNCSCVGFKVCSLPELITNIVPFLRIYLLEGQEKVD